MSILLHASLICALVATSTTVTEAGFLSDITGGATVIAQRQEVGVGTVDDGEHYFPFAIDGADHDIEAVVVDNVSRATINSSESASETVFLVSVDQSRAGTFLANGGYSPEVYMSYRVFFTATAENLLYSFEGQYGAEGGTVLFAGLYDRGPDGTTLSNTVFNNYQESRLTADPSFFSIGGSAGDFTNDLTGSPSGSLIVGHKYDVQIIMGTGAYVLEDDGASGTGYVRLTITQADVGEVPEPASLTLLGLGTLVMGFMMRRRGRNAVAAVA